jgi:hypothetical protein
MHVSMDRRKDTAASALSKPREIVSPLPGDGARLSPLTNVERAFADLKDVLDMRPIYHRSDLRVQAHIYVAALAFLLTHGRAQYTGKGHLMTKARQRERKRRQAEFVTDEEQRLLEIKDMRLVVKFGDKKRYSDSEYEAIYEELVAAGLDDEARRDPDAIEAAFKELNAADEAEAARRDIGG